MIMRRSFIGAVLAAISGLPRVARARQAKPINCLIHHDRFDCISIDMNPDEAPRATYKKPMVRIHDDSITVAPGEWHRFVDNRLFPQAFVLVRRLTGPIRLQVAYCAFGGEARHAYRKIHGRHVMSRGWILEEPGPNKWDACISLFRRTPEDGFAGVGLALDHYCDSPAVYPANKKNWPRSNPWKDPAR